MMAGKILLSLQKTSKMYKPQHIIVWLAVLMPPQLVSVAQSSLGPVNRNCSQQQQHPKQLAELVGSAVLGDEHHADTSSLKQEPSPGFRRFKRRLKSSKLPEFSSPVGNVTAVMGRDVRLVCTVENLGQFQGFYQCQVNTSPMRSTSGYLEVVVPPTIIESQSTKVAEVIEHSEVSLQCEANGHPRPTITWRRDDGSPISLNGRLSGRSIGDGSANQKLAPKPLIANGGRALNLTVVEPPLQQQVSGDALSQLTDVKSDKLSMKSVDRFMAGIYVCTASNGIPSQVSKRIPLYVKFSPKTSVSNKYISVSLGDELEIDCIVEAFPKANTYWSKKSLSSLQDDRGHWDDGSRWLRFNGNSARATLYQAKQILQPSSNEEPVAKSPFDETSSPGMPSAQSNQTLIVAKQSTPDTSSASDPPDARGQAYYSARTKQHGLNDVDMVGSNKRDLSSPSGGNFRSSPPIKYFSTQQGRISSIDQVSGAPTASSSKAYVTVRQTPLNTFTYMLRLSIAQMQPDDYGEYTCVSTNSMGTSESRVMVTKADKTSETTDRQGSDYRSLGEDDYERDSAADQARTAFSNQQQQQQSSVRRASSHGGNRVVYDGNYLQAIKTRQSNLLGPNRLQQQQNLKLRQFSDKNSARSAYPMRQISVMTLAMLVILGRQIQVACL